MIRKLPENASAVSENILKALTLTDSSGASDYKSIFISEYDSDSGFVAVKPRGVFTPENPCGMISFYQLDGISKASYRELDTETKLVFEIYKRFPNIKSVANIHSDYLNTYLVFSSPLKLSRQKYVFSFEGELDYTPVPKTIPEKQLIPTLSDIISEAIKKSYENRHRAVFLERLGTFTFGDNAISAAEYSVSLEYIAKIETSVQVIERKFNM